MLPDPTTVGLAKVRDVARNDVWRDVATFIRDTRTKTAAGDGKYSADFPLLTVAELCALLRISRSTVSRLVARGQLRAVRLGRARRFRRSEVTRLLQGQPA